MERVVLRNAGSKFGREVDCEGGRKVEEKKAWERSRETQAKDC
jgi:hypothetical protein